LEKKPEQRYQTVDDLCSDLAEIEAEMPTTETAISKRESKIKPKYLARKLSKFPGILLVFVLLFIAGYFFYNQFIKKETRDTSLSGITESQNSIIVLPFRDLSANVDQEPLHIIIMEMMILKLHAFRELRVLPSTTSLAFQDSKKDIRTIGNETNTSFVIGGSLWRTEENIHVTIQLSRVESGSLLWTQSFEEPLEGFRDLHDQITKNVAKALGIKNVDRRYQIVTAGMPEESITNENYIRGRHFEILYYATEDEKDFKNCVQNYLNVVKDNPKDANTYWRMGTLYEARYNIEKEQEYLDFMFEYFERAYSIDPDFALANMGMGWSYFYKNDYDQAYRFMEKAYELDPDSAEINFHIGAFFRSIGLYENALRFFIRAIEIDKMPMEFELWYDLLADSYSKLGMFDEAAETLGKALEIYPAYILYIKYAWQLIIFGNYQEALNQIAEAEKLDPERSRIRHYRGLIFASQGNRAKALEQIHKDDVSYVYRITSIYSLLGMKDEAIRNIQLGLDVGFEQWGLYFYSYPFLKSNPFYENLRGDTRFQEILQKEKTKYEEKIRRFRGL
jgi:TolB-like protein/Tfp pilus assembly protein PilF